jgi:hypothetical protein
MIAALLPGGSGTGMGVEDADNTEGAAEDPEDVEAAEEEEGTSVLGGEE